MITLSYEDAHKLEASNPAFFWDEWALVHFAPTKHGFSNKKGMLRNGQWGIANRFNCTQEGTWLIPRRFVA